MGCLYLPIQEQLKYDRGSGSELRVYDELKQVEDMRVIKI
jgi:hypothetical protein